MAREEPRHNSDKITSKEPLVVVNVIMEVGEPKGDTTPCGCEREWPYVVWKEL